MNLSDTCRFLRKLRADIRGVSAMEFGLISPILLLVAVGTADFGRLLLMSHKLQNSAFILGDLAGRDETLSEAQMTDIFLAIGDLIEPFEFGDNGLAIVTSMTGTDTGTPTVNWQRSGSGTLAATSEAGAEGENGVIPEGLTLAEGDTILVTEVFYSYEPLFGLTTTGHTIHKIAYIRPRLGTLETLLP